MPNTVEMHPEVLRKHWVRRKLVFQVDRALNGPLHGAKFLFRFQDLDFDTVYSLPESGQPGMVVVDATKLYAPNDMGLIDLGECSVYSGDGSNRASLYVGAIYVGSSYDGRMRSGIQGMYRYTTRIHGEPLLFRIEAGYDQQDAEQVSHTQGRTDTANSGSVTSQSGFESGALEAIAAGKVNGSVSTTGPTKSQAINTGDGTLKIQQPVARLLITQIGDPKSSADNRL